MRWRDWEDLFFEQIQDLEGGEGWLRRAMRVRILEGSAEDWQDVPDESLELTQAQAVRS
jgi:hypothetical protein